MRQLGACEHLPCQPWLSSPKLKTLPFKVLVMSLVAGFSQVRWILKGKEQEGIKVIQIRICGLI
uniref:Uncharacterized protein n=1 Tax=Rhizophora mucronata TaxID=61149 RepID=A0A2P2NMZ3_RHIMU